MFKSGNQVIKSSLNKDIVFDFRYKKTNQKKPIIIFIHGFKAFKDWGHFNLIADYFTENNFCFLKLNLSHNGTSFNHPLDFVDLEAFGNNNFSKEIDDIKSIVNHIKTNFQSNDELDTSKLFLIGHSKGGATSIITSQEIELSGTVTWNAVLDIKNRYASNELAYWKQEGVIYIDNARTQQKLPLYYQLAQDVLDNEDRFNIPYLLKNHSNQLLILHGELDETVSLQETTQVIDQGISTSTTFKKIKGSDHTFGGFQPYTNNSLPKTALTYCNETIQYINKLI